jgi:hypothetical protein
LLSDSEQLTRFARRDDFESQIISLFARDGMARGLLITARNNE